MTHDPGIDVSVPGTPGESGTLADHYWEGDEEGHDCSVCAERDDSLFLCWPQVHLCFLCMETPCAWPDIACGPCRADANARSDVSTDPIERLLSEHARFESLCSEHSTYCRCALTFSGGPAYHRRHVAELIYDALGIEGPVPWQIGPLSESRFKFGPDHRIIPDEAVHDGGSLSSEVSDGQ